MKKFFKFMNSSSQIPSCCCHVFPSIRTHYLGHSQCKLQHSESQPRRICDSIRFGESTSSFYHC